MLPATPLLVPGGAGAAQVLAATRGVVRTALAELRAALPDGVAPVVLAHGRRTRTGPLRPSLAAAGIPDRAVPAVARWAAGPARSPGEPGTVGVAGTPASVALLCLAEAGLPGADVVEVPAEPEPADVGAALAALRAAPAVVVAGGGVPGGPDRGSGALAPGVAAVLEPLVASAGWSAEVRTAAERHEHLPAEYRVTLYRAP